MINSSGSNSNDPDLHAGNLPGAGEGEQAVHLQNQGRVAGHDEDCLAWVFFSETKLLSLFLSAVAVSRLGHRVE